MLQSAQLLLLLAPLQGGLVGVDEGALLGSDAASWDRAGEALAFDAQTAVVGARWQDASGADAGAAYVHIHSGTSWAQQQKLTASDGAAADEFGWSVAIDQDTIVVGAPTADIAALNEGAAYVFVRSGGVWTEQAKLTASDLFDEDRFGSAVAINNDTLLVGATADDDLGLYSGSVYVFTRSGTVWTESAKLVASNGQEGSYFGYSLDLEPGTAIIGSPGPSGGAYVFVGSGTTWTEQARLTHTSPSNWDRFGESVSLFGERVAVGSPMDDDNGSDSGTVSIFDRSGTVWSPSVSLVAGELFGEFGMSVALSTDRLVAGAPRDQHLSSTALGAAYVFEFTNGAWTQSAALTSSTASSLDEFGASVGVAGDVVVVGTPGGNLAGTNSGHARGYLLLPGISRFCFGDGSGTSCPCSNAALGETGCSNSSGVGASLDAAGAPSVSSDGLSLTASGMLPGQPALLFAGLNAVNSGSGNQFGDGLRCAGGSVVRIGVLVPDAAGTASWGSGIAASSGVSSGDTRRYQCWYRDPVGGPCGSAFNLSNGVRISFTP